MSIDAHQIGILADLLTSRPCRRGPQRWQEEAGLSAAGGGDHDRPFCRYFSGRAHDDVTGGRRIGA